MFKKLKDYYYPATIKETIKLLKTKPDKTFLYAGGTSMGFNKYDSIERVVDISNLPLRYINKNKNSIKIGALTTISDIFKSDLLKKQYNGLFIDVVKGIGSTLNRNMITVGGNISQLYKWSDLPPVLMVMKGSVILHDGKKSSRIPFKKFFEKHPKLLLKNKYIITAIDLKIDRTKTVYDYYKISKTKTDLSLISLAIRKKISRDKIVDVEIAVNGYTAKPELLNYVRRLLLNKNVKSIATLDIPKAIDKDIKEVRDFRIKKGYKKQVLVNLINKSLGE